VNVIANTLGVSEEGLPDRAGPLSLTAERSRSDPDRTSRKRR
jgi:hypothetical protein